MALEGGKVCVIGIWHLGAVTSVCLADMGYDVIGVDPDSGIVDGLNSGHPPLFEPGLEDLLRKNLESGRLQYTIDLADAVSDAPFILITFDTPVDQDDEVDLSQIFAVTKNLASSMEDGAVVIISSQVPVGTCQRIADTLRSIRPSMSFGFACVPENLRLGQAIHRFCHPDMLVIGGDTAETSERVRTFFQMLETSFVVTDVSSAEMTKHAINSYLATCISFANELAGICDLVGADSLKVIEALRLDARVSSNAPLRPGSGFSGGTLARDVKVLLHLGDAYNDPLLQLKGVWDRNQQQGTIAVRRLRQIFPSLSGKTISVLGLTYKPGTSTLRRSASLEVIDQLVLAGASVRAFDPKADPEELKEKRNFVVCDSVEDAVYQSNALIIATPWAEFKDIDYQGLSRLMSDKVIVDAHNFLDPTTLGGYGFLYLGVGRGTLVKEGSEK